MSFKSLSGSLLTYLLYGSLILFQTHCSYFFREKLTPKETLLKTQIENCFSSGLKNFELYFENPSQNPSSFNLNDRDLQNFSGSINQLSECYQKSLKSFVDLAKSGQGEETQFEASEIQRFLSRLYPQWSLSTESIEKYLEIKHFLFKGSKTSISKGEINQISQILPQISHLMTSFPPLPFPYNSIDSQGASIKKHSKNISPRALGFLKAQ